MDRLKLQPHAARRGVELSESGSLSAFIQARSPSICNDAAESTSGKKRIPMSTIALLVVISAEAQLRFCRLA